MPAPVARPRLPSAALSVAALPVADVPAGDVLLSLIDTDADTQVREALDEATVQRYTEALQQDPPEVFPPVDLRQPPGSQRYLIGDGYHRIAAHQRAGRLTIKGRVRPGGPIEAIQDGLRGNGQHGLPMSQGDRARAVRLLLESDKFKRGELSQGEIARQVKIAPSRVSQIAQALTIQGRIVAPDVRTDRNGRQVNTAKIGKAPEAKEKAARPAQPSKGQPRTGAAPSRKAPPAKLIQAVEGAWQAADKAVELLDDAQQLDPAGTATGLAVLAREAAKLRVRLREHLEQLREASPE